MEPDSVADAPQVITERPKQQAALRTGGAGTEDPTSASGALFVGEQHFDCVSLQVTIAQPEVRTAGAVGIEQRHHPDLSIMNEGPTLVDRAVAVGV